MPSHTEAEKLKRAREVLEQGNVIGQSAQKFAESQRIKAPFTPTTFTTSTPTTATTPSGTTVNAITGELLKPAPEIKFETAPQPKPAFPTDQLSAEIPEVKLGKVETELSDFIKDIQKIREQTLGESAFRTEQETATGLPELRKTQLDLSNQLRTLQAEAKSLEITPKFEERNVLAPFAEGERARAIRDVTARALIVSANLQAAQGNIATALEQVDRAVAAKYGPKKEELDIKLRNLELALKDPRLTAEQKARAEAQTKRQEAEKNQLDIKRDNAKKVGEIAVKAAEGGADAITLQKIQQLALSDNPNPVEATQLAVPFLKKEEKVSTGVDLAEFKAFFPNVDITTPAGRQQFLDFQRQKGEAERKEEEVEKDKKLSILDIQRIKEIYGIDLPFGTTEKQAEEIIFKAGQPKEFTDEEFRQIARTAKTGEETFEQVIADIEANPQILNKDRAKLIVSEIYGKKGKGIFERIFSGEKKKEEKKRETPKGTTGREIQEGAARQVSSLFDQVKSFNSQFSGL